jgi:hypothetical protein
MRDAEDVMYEDTGETLRRGLTTKALAKLRPLLGSPDPEVAHGDADDVLCELLRSLGFNEVVDVWEKAPKWYA